MKNKKIWSRIGSILACVLLVGLLAVPCFADTQSSPSTTFDDASSRSTISYGTAIDLFTDSMDPRSDNYSYGLLQSYYRGFGDSRFFDIPTFISGYSDIRNTPSYTFTPPVTLNSPLSDYSSVYYEIPVDSFAYAMYALFDDTSPAVYNVFGEGEIWVDLQFNDDSSTLDIGFHVGGGSVPYINYSFTGVLGRDGFQYELTDVYIGQVHYDTTQIRGIDVSFAVTETATPYLLPFVCAFLFERDIATYDDVSYSPRDFYVGLDTAYNLGYNDGNRYGYQRGYNEGYNIGYNEGLEQGRSETDYDTVYDEGYYDAVREIESGDFGRNFLSGIFTAPLDAMRDFVLVSWVTQDGTTISINLISILSAVVGLSLFIWFLKTFAGG